MNELKPEDVMRALDILDKMDFFQGQRAGRELWFKKPFEVQEQDIADFSQGIDFVKNLITNALVLLREKDAEIERLRNEKVFALRRLIENIKANARAEAITEFEKKLMEKKCHYTETEHTFDFDGVTVEDIEQTAKELKGEPDEN